MHNVYNSEWRKRNPFKIEHKEYGVTLLLSHVTTVSIVNLRTLDFAIFGYVWGGCIVGMFRSAIDSDVFDLCIVLRVIGLHSFLLTLVVLMNRGLKPLSMYAFIM